jgi:carboxyvinyl-carboxyphosphonate phosphorylmutase
MSGPRERLREIIDRPGCTSVAPVFDPLSARIAELQGWEVVKVSGSVGKFANLAVPDGVPMTNMSDLADVCRRITRVADVSLVVDADDGGSALSVRRMVQELEASGVCAMELEDNLVPKRFIESRHQVMVDRDEHTRKLEAAVAAKRDPNTLIVGRTTALFITSLDDALERIKGYVSTGIDAIMLPGLGKEGLSSNPREDIAAVQRVANLPLFVSGLPAELVSDEEWMTKCRIKLRFNGQAAYRMAVQGIYEGLDHLRSGGNASDLSDKWAPSDLLEKITRVEELRAWDKAYGFGNA